jgi:hypothetical protein
MHLKQKQTFQVKEDKVEGSQAKLETNVSHEKEIAMRNIIKEDLAFRQNGKRDANTETKPPKTTL